MPARLDRARWRMVAAGLDDGPGAPEWRCRYRQASLYCVALVEPGACDDDDAPGSSHSSDPVDPLGTAPLPPHERTWRHPSELGAAQWIATEPPIVIGRGLTAVTGAIGLILATGLLWAMLPSAGGRPTA